MSESDLGTSSPEATNPEMEEFSMTLFHVLAEELKKLLPNDLTRWSVLLLAANLAIRLAYPNLEETQSRGVVPFVQICLVGVNTLAFFHEDWEISEAARIIAVLIVSILTNQLP